MNLFCTINTGDTIRVKHTCVFNIFHKTEGVVGVHGVGVIKCGGVEESKGSFVCFDGPPHAFLTQISHEQLKADEGKHRKSEDGQNHDVHHLLH